MVFTALIVIGLKLGMTFEDMEKSYFEKNQVNYNRLASGY
nr:dUTP diphosphatase [Bacillus cereus]